MRYLFLIFLTLLVSCGKSKDTKIEGVEMGMAYKVLIREQISKETLVKVKKITNDTFEQIDHTLNHWNESSEISSVNKSTSTEKIEVSTFLLDAIKIADTVFCLSDGRYDPSTGKIIHLWKMALRIGKIPSDEEIEKYRDCSGWDRVIIHENGLQKTHPALEIDLDGITKGYFCDILTERLKNVGLKNFLVEWAGEIKVTGGPFNILVKDMVISLKDKAIATSGPSFQLFSIGNVLYSHFIDPKTLKCIEIKDISLSKSITDDSCAIADGLATASILK